MGAGTVQKDDGGGRRRRRRGSAQPMAEINVTPFVDVMLVLLIMRTGQVTIRYLLTRVRRHFGKKHQFQVVQFQSGLLKKQMKI